MTNKQQQSPIFCLDKLKKHLYNTIWGIKPLLMIVDGVTHELTLQDVENDPNWITKSTCIVTSNVDRAIINAEAAKAFGK
jgi:hypothetical protein